MHTRLVGAQSEMMNCTYDTVINIGRTCIFGQTVYNNTGSSQQWDMVLKMAKYDDHEMA